jgi:hypothetical protein
LSLSHLAKAALLIAAVLVFAAGARAEDLEILFKTTPRIEHLRPYADPATMSLLITGSDGRPIRQGTVDVRLDAPKSGHFFSTDFPWVEGSRLQEMRLELRQGRANWKYLFPIRGEYRLGVDVETPEGKKTSKEFTFTIREREEKWATLAAFSAALFCLGFVAGRIFTRMPTAAVALALGLLLVSDGFTENEKASDNEETALEIGPTTVGTPALVRWHTPSGVAGDGPVEALSLRIVHLEKGKTAFEMERVPIAGDFAMKFEFTDGAEYRVSALAEQAGKPPRQSEKIISATALEPPVKAMIPAFAYFVGLIALGLGAGRWSKRKVRGNSAVRG